MKSRSASLIIALAAIAHAGVADARGGGGRGGGGGFRGGGGGARGVAAGAAVGLTAAAIGSVAYSLPTGCGPLLGWGYYSCGGVYYEPQYSGDNITYVVVENPDQ